MKIRAKNGGQTVDITLPATDMDMQYFKRKRVVGKAYFLRKKNHCWHHYLLPVLN